MSCISPRAPFRETQFVLKSDSTWMTARTSVASTRYCFAYFSMIRSYFEGRSCCCASHFQSLPRALLLPKLVMTVRPPFFVRRTSADRVVAKTSRTSTARRRIGMMVALDSCVHELCGDSERRRRLHFAVDQRLLS